MKYQLKLSEEYFSLVQAGIKNFEIRLADRPYKIGDVLVLAEVDLRGEYTGRTIYRKIGYLFKTGTMGKFYSRRKMRKYGLVVLGLEQPHE